MAARNEKMQRVQLGVESANAWGTAVAQTSLLMGKPKLSYDPKIEQEFWAEQGEIIESDSLIAGVGIEAALEMIPTYEHVQLMFNSMFGSAPVTGSGPYTRHWRVYRDVVPTNHAIYTLVSGDAARAYAVLGALASKFMLKIKAKDKSIISTDFMGKRGAVAALDELDKEVGTFVRSSDTVVSISAIGMAPAALSCDIAEVDVEFANGLSLYDGMGSLESCGYDHMIGDVAGKIRIVGRADAVLLRGIAESLIATDPEPVYRHVLIQSNNGGNMLRIHAIGRLEGVPNLFEFANGRGVLTLEFSIASRPGATSPMTDDTALVLTLTNEVA